MDIPQKFLWPLIGVLLGWLLSMISSGWKARTEKYKLLGRLLTRLMDLHGDLKKLIRVSEHIKDIAGGWSQYERLRRRIYDKHFLDNRGKLDDLPNLISDLSNYLPFEAFALQFLSQTLIKSKDVSLDASSHDKETYVRLISMHEATMDQCEKELSKLVRTVAL